MITSEDCILYIEDDTINRDAGLKNIRSDKINPYIIEAPASTVDCETSLKKKNIYTAIIDFKLSKWVGANSENPIHIDQQEKTNGIQLAKYLLNKSPRMQIGMFSAFESDLKDKLAEANLEDKVTIINQEVKHPRERASVLPNYLSRFFDMSVKIKQLHKADTGTPVPVQSYFAKKLVTSIELGEDLWRAGKYAWQVFVNKTPHVTEPETADSDEFTLNNPIEEYKVGIDKTGIFVNSFEESAHDYSFNREADSLHEFIHKKLLKKPNEISDTISETIVSLFTSKLFLESKLDAKKVIEFLDRLSETAKLVCQKSLFTSMPQQDESLHRKEDVYKVLKPFADSGFPCILDVFTGRIDEVEDDKAYVKFESLSPTRSVRAEVLNYTLLQEYGLEENSEFEYTIYKTQSGGHAYHIEPI